MKKINSKVYLYVAAAGMLIIAGMICFYMFASLSKSEQVEYVYIDADDTQDSVFAKLAPIASHAGLTGFKTLARHLDYSSNIRTGRYAINPGEGAVLTFRKLRNGMQTSMKLTIPEVRTMDRLAAVLGQKLMLDSAAIAEALTPTKSIGIRRLTACLTACRKSMIASGKVNDRQRLPKCSLPLWRFVRWRASLTRKRQIQLRNP